MVRKFIGAVAVTLAVALSTQAADAQDAGRGFSKGNIDVAFGPGFGETGEASSAYVLRLEYGLKALGKGALGLQAGVGLYSWDFPIAAHWDIWPLTLQANYHFNMNPEARFQPFVGVGGGYKVARCAGQAHMWRDCSAEEDEAIIVARAGGRFFFSQRVGLYADAGIGGPIGMVGVVVRLW